MKTLRSILTVLSLSVLAAACGHTSVSTPANNTLSQVASVTPATHGEGSWRDLRAAVDTAEKNR